MVDEAGTSLNKNRGSWIAAIVSAPAFTVVGRGCSCMCVVLMMSLPSETSCFGVGNCPRTERCHGHGSWLSVGSLSALLSALSALLSALSAACRLTCPLGPLRVRCLSAVCMVSKSIFEN